MWRFEGMLVEHTICVIDSYNSREGEPALLEGEDQWVDEGRDLRNNHILSMERKPRSIS
jgi:hypothetical protein